MTERKPPERHPSTAIPQETVADITYRWYLRRLDPPMTPEESHDRVTTIVVRGKPLVQDDAYRRKNSAAFQSSTRDYLRVLVDIGMIKL